MKGNKTFWLIVCSVLIVLATMTSALAADKYYFGDSGGNLYSTNDFSTYTSYGDLGTNFFDLDVTPESFFVGATNAAPSHYSVDGITWQNQTIGMENTWSECHYSPEEVLWVCGGLNGALYTSSNGTSWTSRSSGFGSNEIQGVHYSIADDLWTIVGTSADIATSSDGITWTSQTTGLTQSLYAISYSETDDLWIIGGLDDIIQSSSDGVTWTSRQNLGYDIYSVDYSEVDDLWVAVGASGGMHTSSDGITWTSRTSSFGTDVIYRVKYDEVNNLWIASGASGKIATSSDGITWTQETSPTIIATVAFAINNPLTPLSNFFTIETASFSFETPVSIGAGFGVVNSITSVNNNTDSSSIPYYWASSFSVNATVASTAHCRIAVNGTTIVESTRSLEAGTVGNFKLIAPPTVVSFGDNVITTECEKTSGGNYEVINSQMTEFHFHDHANNETIPHMIVNASTFPLNTTDTLLASFNWTTGDVTNTTNIISLIAHGRATYSYDNDDNITTYLKVRENGDMCGNYTRGGLSGTSGSVGTTCNFIGLNSSTTYNLDFYGSTEVGIGSLDDLLINVYELQTNDTATVNVKLDKVIPANVTTLIKSINVTNVLGGNYHVFVDSGIMVKSNVTQDAYFFINNTERSILYYRTLTGNDLVGNVNGQFTFTESGTDAKDFNLYAYCPSGCTVTGADLTAFVTDAEAASTGLFNVTAYNVYNDTILQNFNVTVGGATQTTTNGYIELIAQGNVNVLVEAQNFFSNTTLHDTTTDLNASLAKYVEIRANEFAGGGVINYTVNMTGATYTTTNGVSYLPVIDGTTVSFNSPANALNNQILNKTQFFNFSVFAERSLLLTFKDANSDLIINNITFDYWSNSDNGVTNTTNGTIYLTLLQPESYTFRYNSSGYNTNFYFITVLEDSYENITLYLSKNSDSITIEIIDSSAAVVENAIVNAQQFFVDDNTYRTIASGNTNTEGETLLSLFKFTEYYKFQVIVAGEVVKLTDPFVLTKDTLRIQVNLEAEEYLEEWEQYRNIASDLVFNKATNNFRFTFVSPTVYLFCLDTYKRSVTSDTLIHNTCTTGSSGTILHNVTNITGDTYYSVSTVIINSQVSTLNTATHTFPLMDIGDKGLFGQILLTIVFALAGFLGVEMLLLATPLSLIIGGFIGLHNIGLEFTVPIFIIGLFLSFILRKNNG